MKEKEFPGEQSEGGVGIYRSEGVRTVLSGGDSVYKGPEAGRDRVDPDRQLLKLEYSVCVR